MAAVLSTSSPRAALFSSARSNDRPRSRIAVVRAAQGVAQPEGKDVTGLSSLRLAKPSLSDIQGLAESFKR